LYYIVRHKNDTIAKMLETFPPNVTFRRSLIGPRQISWHELLQHLELVPLTQRSDVFRWNLTGNGSFSDIPVDNNSKIWKMKIPLKTKVFAWYLRCGVILTKDNLAKHNWHGCKKCVFCHQDETIKHLFFQCKFARSIWSAVQIGSTLYPPRSVADIFGN
jgi:hypothetical protein